MNLCYRDIHYEPALGQFLTADPHPGQLGNPITFNSKYIYGNNNPVITSDPNGRLGIVLGILIAGAISGGISHLSGGNFIDGFILGAAAATGTAIGAALLVGLSGAAVGTAAAVGWGAVGGAAGSMGVSYLFGVRGFGLFTAGVAGALGGAYMGARGFDLWPARDAMSDTAGGVYDANRGVQGSLPPDSSIPNQSPTSPTPSAPVPSKPPVEVNIHNWPNCVLPSNDPMCF